jgi:AraC-like DNA-binding protein
MQAFPICGVSETVNNKIARVSTPSRSVVFEPGAVSFAPTAGFENFVILFDPQMLLRTISTLAGSPVHGPLKLDRANFGDRPEARLSRGLVKLLVEELDAEDSIPSPLVIAELEQAIVVAFLCGTTHNYSGVLDGRPPGAAPWQIRRVEEYVEANWNQPISIEALAVVANASARSIFHSFKEHRRYSPMNFVKRVRLKHAREQLSAGPPETTVTNVAFVCGFGNLGHFASDYKRAFGEAPSTTLLQAKSGARLASRP